MIIYNNKAFQPISIRQEGKDVIIKGKYEAIGHVGGMEIDGKYEGGKEVVFYGGIGYKKAKRWSKHLRHFKNKEMGYADKITDRPVSEFIGK